MARRQDKELMKAVRWAPPPLVALSERRAGQIRRRKADLTADRANLAARGGSGSDGAHELGILFSFLYIFLPNFWRPIGIHLC